ncbi:hypothetical protein BBJ28_00011850 [Nothophytophthora sp. Chile5]|nr:hypothetical protein BBJ28_00011850 [Nothophytophthora sp. Chile5]
MIITLKRMYYDWTQQKALKCLNDVQLLTLPSLTSVDMQAVYNAVTTENEVQANLQGQSHYYGLYRVLLSYDPIDSGGDLSAGALESGEGTDEDEEAMVLAKAMALSISAAKHKQHLDDEETKTAATSKGAARMDVTTSGRSTGTLASVAALGTDDMNIPPRTICHEAGRSRPCAKTRPTTSVAEEEQQVAASMVTLSSSVDVLNSVGERPAAPEPRVGLAEERVDSLALTESVSPVDPCSLRQSLGLTAWASQACLNEFRANNSSAVTEMGVEWSALLRIVKACNNFYNNPKWAKHPHSSRLPSRLPQILAYNICQNRSGYIYKNPMEMERLFGVRPSPVAQPPMLDRPIAGVTVDGHLVVARETRWP